LAKAQSALASPLFFLAASIPLILSLAPGFSLNGNGEMTGTTWLEESGFLEGPIMITNTSSVGVVRDAVIAWRMKQGP
jgi:L-aminopeptidase/D-esterase-like protein